MNSIESTVSRRNMLRGGLALGALAMMPTWVFAEQLAATPSLTIGPYYPDKLPLDTDNDLIIINNSLTPAIGQVTNLTGRILGANGEPIRNALVEIWQCDANQVYLHTSDSVPKDKQRDHNFQGYGKFETSSKGDYGFRTIRPVPYPGRPAPHIHFRISKGGRDLLITQLFIEGFAGNKNDGVFKGLKDPVDRELVCTDFTAGKDSKVAALSAKWDIVLGKTPADTDGDH